MLDGTDKSYLSEIEEETGVLASFREVGEKDCDADEEHRRILAHLPQRLAKRSATYSLAWWNHTGGKKLQQKLRWEETQNSWLFLV